MIASDLRAMTRLVVEATVGVTDLVEAVHARVQHPLKILAPPVQWPIRAVTALSYAAVRRTTQQVGRVLDYGLHGLTPVLGEQRVWPGREPLLAALNGVLGDHLAASANALATPMTLRHAGRALPMERAALAEAMPQLNGRLLIFVHGLCMNDLQWTRAGQNFGAALHRELGYTPLYLRYNSGRHISTNGRAFAAQLEALQQQWPVPIEEVNLIGHSLGGLLSRSACHYAQRGGHAWLRSLRRLITLGTPHHGARLERGGNWVDVLLGANAYTAPFARLGKIRSAAITDLRHGSLRDEDWQGRDRFARPAPLPQPVPLPAGVACYAIAATAGRQSGGIGNHLLGDGLVDLRSALGRHDDPLRDLSIPAARQWVGHGMTHLDLLSHAAVLRQLKVWLDEDARSAPAPGGPSATPPQG